jgi:TetR/AcrR family transcriptional repressor of bet genes
MASPRLRQSPARRKRASVPLRQTAAAHKARTRKAPLDRKQEIVEASIAVLAEQGYAAFTLARVAQAAGVSTALIIVHFKSKDRLLTEVLKRLGQSYYGALHASQFGTRGGPADLLWSLVEAEFADESFPPRHFAAWKTFWTETEARRAYVALFAPQALHFLELTTELCRRIVAEGHYPDHDPVVAARLIDTLLGGLWIDMTVAPKPLTVEQARLAARAQLALVFPQHFTAKGPR